VKLTILNQSGRGVPQAFLRDWVRRMDRALGRRIDPRRFRRLELTLVFLPEAQARALNKRFRKRDYATDVLSFAPVEAGNLGELVICPSVISKQAKEHGMLVREELGYMVLHGFLHLLGYDHEKSAREARVMFALQDELFAKLLSVAN
jgi:probable rRNA maturation factor